ncbi:LysM peptidoglycan-binding domain-containing protein [Nereida sp. MMG025]|uniref:LysM peptidoglycan-binding domain-containing protein n=1 Tax=Nereida sp. MMG025 TaxID=2909981 RepID=UPI001F172018|nr:LysM peptidoglycan-binding domain-containing protein [Nereida sp. MMG025]MCF6444448.1 LysM peptidoglycan-binding domain-containing protein [Nereida sp. MMG025]
MTTANKPAAPNYLPMLLAIGAFSFVVGGAVTYQIVKLTGGQTAPLAETSMPETASPEVTRAEAPTTDVSSLINGLDLQSAATALIVVEDKPAFKPPQPETILEQSSLTALKQGVLSGVLEVGTTDDDRLALTSTDGSFDMENAKSLIAQAASNGALTVPEGLDTEAGDLDRNTLLLAVVQQSLEAGNKREQDAARNLREQAFKSSIAQTTAINGARYYTVKPGDSLAYISLQFYGSPSAYIEIFQANRDTLTSPDQIFIGQKLLIPSV